MPVTTLGAGPASNATGAAPRRLSTLDAPSTTAFSSSHIDAMRAHHRSLDVGCPPTPHRNRYVLPDTCSWLTDPPQLVASTSREDIVTCSDELTSLLTLHSIAKCRALCKSTRVSSTRVSPSRLPPPYARFPAAATPTTHVDFRQVTYMGIWKDIEREGGEKP